MRFSTVFLLHAPAPTPYSAVFLLHAPAPAPIKIGCGLVRCGSCGLVGCIGKAYTPTSKGFLHEREFHETIITIVRYTQTIQVVIAINNCSLSSGQEVSWFCCRQNLNLSLLYKENKLFQLR